MTKQEKKENNYKESEVISEEMGPETPRSNEINSDVNLDQETLASQISYASFDRRLISFTIDVTITFLLITIIQNIHNILFENTLMSKMNHFFIEYGGQQNGISLGTLWNYMVEQHILRDYLIWQFLIPFGIMTAYIILSWLKFNGATLGKWLTRTRIVDAKTFQSPTLSQYIARFLSYPLLILTLGIGLAMISFRNDKRGLHDIIAGTAVICKVKKTKIINTL